MEAMSGGDVQAELSERQVYSAFHDALFCFEEAKKIQRYERKVSHFRLMLENVISSSGWTNQRQAKPCTVPSSRRSTF